MRSRVAVGGVRHQHRGSVAAPPAVVGALPLSRHTLTRPDPDKWKRNADALERVLPVVEPTWERIQRWLEAGN